MDSGSVSKHKKKPSKSQRSNEGLDMISNLPDFIIGHILSCLPTKDAVRTSILSKRWIYLWTFITDLRFQDRELYDSKKIKKLCFINFVYRVLLHLNITNIESFSLTISEEYDPYHINEWISAVLNRGVKKLCVYSTKGPAFPNDYVLRHWRVPYLYVDSKKELALYSYSLLKCQSLEEWVLEVNCVIRVPTFVYLSSLTVLKLSGVKFTLDHSNNSENLRLKFPVLRNYETQNCTWSGIKGVTLEMPLLEVVSISYIPRSLSNDSYTAVKFCASHLAEFTYNGYILPDTMMLDLSTPHIASANIVPYKYKEENVQETGILACKLLKQFTDNVECLKFQRSEIFAQAKDSLADLRAFQVLSHLELSKISCEILLAILLKTPVLKILVFKELLKFDKELLNSVIVPDCFSSTLEVLKFGRLDGYEHELCFAKFVMENARVLKRMCFFPTWQLCRSNLKEVEGKLISFKKGFSFAILEFSTV